MRIILIAVVCFLTACVNSNKFELKGQIEGIDSDQLVISKRTDRGIVDVDTIDVENGAFYYTKPSIETDKYFLNFQKSELRMDAILENGKLHLKADKSQAHHGYISKLIIDGAVNQNLFDKYFSFEEELIKKPQYKEVLRLRNKMSEVPHEQFQDVKAEYELAGEEFFKDVWERQFNLLKNNSDKFFVSQVILFIRKPATDAQLKELYGLLPEQTKQHPNVLKIMDQVYARERITKGKLAPDFTLKTEDGKELSLSDLRGKYVLIDFWASWCKPCRKAFPHMKELHNKYHKSGFEILGITNDTNHKLWKKAIEKDELPWVNVADEFPVERGTARVISLYGMQVLPSTVLLDKEGVIIGKQYHGHELDDQLKEIFGF